MSDDSDETNTKKAEDETFNLAVQVRVRQQPTDHVKRFAIFFGCLGICFLIFLIYLFFASFEPKNPVANRVFDIFGI